MERYKDTAFREEMRLKADFNNMMKPKIGAHGIGADELSAMKGELDAAAARMTQNRGSMKWRELPYNQDAIVADLIETASSISYSFDDFVVLGIGGSALGPIAVQQALNHMRYNDLPKEKRGGRPRLFVEDNVDPERMTALFDVIDIEKACFNVITKSGGTSETMAQLLIICDELKKRGLSPAKHIIATTDEKKGNLIVIAKQLGLKTFYVPDGVGGRFSELCPVGLLAAAVCGIDIREMLAGAAYMDEISKNDDIWKNPAYLAGAMMVLMMRNGKNISVMMPYADSLKYMSDWYAQLWAESLGKRYSLGGKDVFTGQTPVKALGVTDQHSQVQLYAEGPFDKVTTFLTVGAYRSLVDIPDGFLEIKDVSFLCGHTMNELIQAEERATEYALLKAGRPSWTLTLPQVNAFTVGQLLYFFEVMTAFAGELLGINTFDQPGVEEGKNATYALLGKPGFDAKKQELDSAPPSDDGYVL